MLNIMGRALPFAHLAGLTRRAAKKADDDENMEKDRPEGEEAEEEEAKAGDGEKDEAAAKPAKSKASDEDPDDDDDEDEDDDDDGDGDGGEKKKNKKSASATPIDVKRAEKRGRKKERARCAKIFATEAAARNVQMAAKLAFNTAMSADSAIAILESAPQSSSLATRMETAKPPKVGPGTDKAGAMTPESVDASWERAMRPYRAKNAA